MHCASAKTLTRSQRLLTAQTMSDFRSFHVSLSVSFPLPPLQIEMINNFRQLFLALWSERDKEREREAGAKFSSNKVEGETQTHTHSHTKVKFSAESELRVGEKTERTSVEVCCCCCFCTAN